jgi:hypothetical protein
MHGLIRVEALCRRKRGTVSASCIKRWFSASTASAIAAMGGERTFAGSIRQASLVSGFGAAPPHGSFRVSGLDRPGFWWISSTLVLPLWRLARGRWHRCWLRSENWLNEIGARKPDNRRLFQSVLRGKASGRGRRDSILGRLRRDCCGHLRVSNQIQSPIQFRTDGGDQIHGRLQSALQFNSIAQGVSGTVPIIHHSGPGTT